MSKNKCIYLSRFLVKKNKKKHETVRDSETDESWGSHSLLMTTAEILIISKK